MLKKLLIIILSSLFLVVIFSIIKMRSSKNIKFLNIVLIGIAGSGKGTQGDLIKDKFNLYKLSAGDALREHRENKGKYTEIINQKIDKGELVPSEITSDIMFEKVEKVIEEQKFQGVLYDGFPRNLENEESLDKFLKSKNMKVDLVVYINVKQEEVLDRLKNRMTCGKCGAIYNKKTKTPKHSGICDECGNGNLSERADDGDLNAIKSRFDIFEKMTYPVLENYRKNTQVLELDGNRAPNLISTDILKKVKEIIEE